MTSQIFEKNLDCLFEDNSDKDDDYNASTAF